MKFTFVDQADIRHLKKDYMKLRAEFDTLVDMNAAMVERLEMLELELHEVKTGQKVEALGIE